jgi:hypothetical protein
MLLRLRRQQRSFTEIPAARGEDPVALMAAAAGNDKLLVTRGHIGLLPLA